MSMLKAEPEQVAIPPTPIETETVYRSETDIETFTRENTLTGEDVVEGFSCQVSQLFE